MYKALMLIFLIGLSQYSMAQDNSTEVLPVNLNDFSPVSPLKNGDTKAIVLLDSGVYEYLIEKTGNTIQMKRMLIFNRTTFDPEDYNTLRNFYVGVIKKENEVIVFRKIR